MMRRGPLAGNPIESLLDAAADERANGVIELHSVAEGRVYLVEGEIYLADLVEQRPLEQLLLEAGLLTQAQIERHTEPGDDGPYLALALDTDATIDEHAIADWLLERTATTLARFVGVDQGEYELDPYASHSAGILASWTHREVLDRARVLRIEAEERAEADRIEADRLDAERRAEIERREAAQRADAERTEAARLQAAREAADRGGVSERPGGPEQSGGAEGTPGGPDVGSTDTVRTDPDPTDAGGPDVADPHADLPPPPDAPIDVPPVHAVDAQVLIVTSDAAPDGLDVIELSPLEWRVVVLAARGMSLTDLARRLDLGQDEVAGAVAALSDRGLLATVG
ncbi:MAG TPA: DUF4388 domain-containing protein [Acidimicrobiales bacterium]|nr:DUF4388 domain-containing protein [Acidimicrobiales bacterium]